MSYTRRDSDVDQCVRREVAIAFDPPEQIVEHCALAFEVDPDELAPIVEQAVAAHARDRESWPAVTDNDRLDAAFAALEHGGIVARQHFACCNRCGHSEIGDEVRQAREAGRTVHGYVFYHRQDSEGAVDGDGLRLRYDATGAAPGAKAATGRQIVERLGAHGFTIEWNGDPEIAILIPAFVWRRRERPADTRSTWTAETCRERWCADVGRMLLADFAGRLGDLYPTAAIAIGCVDVAMRWGRAPLPDPGDTHTRSLSLAHLAAALRDADAAPAIQIRDLWIEAFATAPWGANGALVDLLAATSGELSDPAIRDAAFERATQTGRDELGAAAIAWYLVCAGSDDRIDSEAAIRAARASFETPGQYDVAVPLLGAALWVLHARRGLDDEAAPFRDQALDALRTSTQPWPTICPQRAALAAAAAVGELDPIVDDLLTHNEDLAGALVDAFVAAGRLDDAADLVERRLSVRMFARLARRAPDDVRAVHWRERAIEREADIDDFHMDGLISTEQRRDARLELVMLRAGTDPDRARADLVAQASEIAAIAIAADAGVRAQLEHVRAGTSPTPDDSWFTPLGESALETALAKWTQASSRSARIGLHRSGTRILEAAAAFAHSDPDRARALLSVVIPDDDELDALPGMCAPAAIRAWIELGDLDRAVEQARDVGVLLPDSIAPLAIALAAAGRVPEALAWIGSAFETAGDCHALHALAPAIAAVAEDPAACASALLDAWSSAEVSLGTLIP